MRRVEELNGLLPYYFQANPFLIEKTPTPSYEEVFRLTSRECQHVPIASSIVWCTAFGIWQTHIGNMDHLSQLAFPKIAGWLTLP